MEETEKPYAAVVLIGPPASGKGTLATALAARWGISVVTPGNIYKRMREEDTAEGKIVKAFLNDTEGPLGGLCPDSLTNKIVKDESLRLGGTDHGVILDGYPRTDNQYNALKLEYRVGLYVIFDVPESDIVDAAVYRRECPLCGKVFRDPDAPVASYDAQSPCQCPVDPKDWKTRWDDTAEMVSKRVRTYRWKTEHITNAIRADHDASRITIAQMSDGTAILNLLKIDRRQRKAKRNLLSGKTEEDYAGRDYISRLTAISDTDC